MTNARRDMMLRVIDGDSRVIPYMFHLSEYRRCDKVLSFLINHRLTGAEFIRWSRNNGWDTPGGAAANALAIVEKWTENRTILFGRDVIG